MPPLTLEWRDLTVEVQAPRNGNKKRLLCGVSGVALPGQVVAVMGPSGAGKSVLLDSLAHNQTLPQTGDVTVNGAQWTKAMRRRMSYIVQHDLFYETITVEEHLTFQGRLRLGNSLSYDEIASRVSAVMSDLGLIKCRNAQIGGGGAVRGISGGERKRLSLATEMLTDPMLLLVDEPTSGLDSHMALAIVQLLQRLARDGKRTVVLTIHQPSPAVFACFDRLHLLAEGSTVYDGPATDALEYFESNGLQCPEFTSPSDFFIRSLVVDTEDDGGDDVDGAERLEHLKIQWKRRQALEPAPASSHATETTMDDTAADASTLGLRDQLLVLVRRNFIRVLRDRIAFRAAVLQSLFISLLVGSVYYQLDLDQSGIQNIVGVLFFVSINQALISCKPAFSAVTSELSLLKREHRAGLFNLAAWYIAKNVSELVLQLVLPVVYFLPQYLLIFGVEDLGRYLPLQLIVSLLSSAAVGFGYAVSCVFDRSDIASIVGVALLLPFILFGGLFLNAEDAPTYLIWLQYISPIKYCFEALMKIVWDRVGTLPCQELQEACVATSGRDVLQLYGISGSRTAVSDGAILVGINLAFRVVGLVALVVNLRRK